MCDLAPTKLTEESKVGVEGNGSEGGLTPLEEVKPHKVLKPAAAADGRQGGCGTFGRCPTPTHFDLVSPSKLLRKKKQHPVKTEGQFASVTVPLLRRAGTSNKRQLIRAGRPERSLGKISWR